VPQTSRCARAPAQTTPFDACLTILARDAPFLPLLAHAGTWCRVHYSPSRCAESSPAACFTFLAHRTPGSLPSMPRGRQTSKDMLSAFGTLLQSGVGAEGAAAAWQHLHAPRRRVPPRREGASPSPHPVPPRTFARRYPRPPLPRSCRCLRRRASQAAARAARRAAAPLAPASPAPAESHVRDAAVRDACAPGRVRRLHALDGARGGVGSDASRAGGLDAPLASLLAMHGAWR
jgi:hypothetical protein